MIIIMIFISEYCEFLKIHGNCSLILIDHQTEKTKKHDTTQILPIKTQIPIYPEIQLFLRR